MVALAATLGDEIGSIATLFVGAEHTDRLAISGDLRLLVNSQSGILTLHDNLLALDGRILHLERCLCREISFHQEVQCARSVAGREALDLGSLEDDRLVSQDVVGVVRESDHLVLHSADFAVFRKATLRAEFVHLFQSKWT